MENNKLIGMTEFVKKEYDKIPEIPTQIEAVKFAITVNNYAKFLSQDRCLYMFVPCDDEGNVLEEPKPEYYFPVDKPVDEFTEEDGKGLSKYYLPMMRYEDAKLKVLFEGFEVKNNQITNGEVTPYYIKEGKWTENEYIDFSIEGLVESKITLSPTSLKQIYG